MIQVPFKIVRTPYPPRSGMTGEVTQKFRDDGRFGPVVGDEALLWDALEEARAELAQLRQQYDALRAEAEEEQVSRAAVAEMGQAEAKRKGRRML